MEKTCPIQESTCKRTITNVNSEELPPITRNEIEMPIKQLRSGKATGDDEILAEMLKENGEPILLELGFLINA